MDLNSPMAQKGPRTDWKKYDPTNPCANNPDITCKKLGDEDAVGRACAKWLFTFLKTGKTETLWLDREYGFPVRAQSEDGSIFEISNIHLGVPDPGLFTPPSDYKVIDMNAAGFGGMMGNAPH
jgi:outer membrane lipoprotein-sorting protein